MRAQRQLDTQSLDDGRVRADSDTSAIGTRPPAEPDPRGLETEPQPTDPNHAPRTGYGTIIVDR